MQKQAPLGTGFSIAWAIGWLALCAAGFLYAREKDIPAWVAVPVVTAFLIEYVFYLVPGFRRVRARLGEAFSRPALALALTLSALVPYLIYSLGTGQFHVGEFAELAVIAGSVGFWYVVFPGTLASDLGLMSVIAAVLLTKQFKSLYPDPLLRVHVDVLGHLMLIRLALMVMLVLRHVRGVGFGFVPTGREALIGLKYFVFFLPVGFAVGWGLGLFRPHGTAAFPWQAVGLFFGIFWVVALSEEFFFRGVLQQGLTKWFGSAAPAIVVSSIVFGLCHLPFRGFPNWRMAAIASVAGLFYGLAFRAAGSIRASMVSHALVVTLWLTWLN